MNNLNFKVISFVYSPGVVAGVLDGLLITGSCAPLQLAQQTRANHKQELFARDMTRQKTGK